MTKSKVLLTTNVPSPYRIDFFNEYGKYIDLTVLFEKKISNERNTRWNSNNFDNFNFLFLKGIKTSTDTAFCPSIIRHILFKKYKLIIICNPLTPTGLFAILCLKLFNKKFIIETDGAFYNKNQKFLNMIRTFSYNSAKLCLSTSLIHDYYYQNLGVNPSKIVRYPFTSIYKKDILVKPITMQTKLEIRKKLGIKEKNILLGVGQFIERKGFDLLLKEANLLDNSYGIYLIGSENIELYRQLLQTTKFSNVHFISFKQKHELWEYYQAADIFILPTREDIWGLVINEAMANGLPIISTNKCLAATELVKEGKNGFLIDLDKEFSIVDIIRNVQTYNSFFLEKNSLNFISNYTIEEMTKAHLKINI